MQTFGSLQEDAQERSVELLAQISLQLSSFTANAQFINSTATPLSRPDHKPSNAAVAINLLSFLSLVLSLMVAFLAILILQWLRQYLDVPIQTAGGKAYVRQRRFLSLGKWRVDQIISSLSVVLQIALVLFLAGLTILLWVLHRPTAYLIMTVIGLFVGGLVATTIIPTIVPDCPYKSPFAWMTCTAVINLTCYVSLLLEWAVDIHILYKWTSAARSLGLRKSC